MLCWNRWNQGNRPRGWRQWFKIIKNILSYFISFEPEKVGLMKKVVSKEFKFCHRAFSFGKESYNNQIYECRINFCLRRKNLQNRYFLNSIRSMAVLKIRSIIWLLEYAQRLFNVNSSFQGLFFSSRKFGRWRDLKMRNYRLFLAVFFWKYFVLKFFSQIFSVFKQTNFFDVLRPITVLTTDKERTYKEQITLFEKNHWALKRKKYFEKKLKKKQVPYFLQFSIFAKPYCMFFQLLLAKDRPQRGLGPSCNLSKRQRASISPLRKKSILQEFVNKWSVLNQKKISG